MPIILQFSKIEISLKRILEIQIRLLLIIKYNVVYIK